MASSAHGAYLIDEEFTGPAGNPPNPAVWDVTGGSPQLTGTANGELNLFGNGGFRSDNVFTNEHLRFVVTSYSHQNGFYGYWNGASQWILVRSDSSTVQVSDGVTTTNSASILPFPGNYIADIFWQANQVRVLIDNVEKFNLTTGIPTAGMNVWFERYSSPGPSSNFQLGSVNVGIPEPTSAVLLLIGASIFIRRRRSRR